MSRTSLRANWGHPPAHYQIRDEVFGGLRIQRTRTGRFIAICPVCWRDAPWDARGKQYGKDRRHARSPAPGLSIPELAEWAWHHRYAAGSLHPPEQYVSPVPAEPVSSF